MFRRSETTANPRRARMSGASRSARGIVQRSNRGWPTLSIYYCYNNCGLPRLLRRFSTISQGMSRGWQRSEQTASFWPTSQRMQLSQFAPSARLTLHKAKAPPVGTRRPFGFAFLISKQESCASSSNDFYKTVRLWEFKGLGVNAKQF